MSKDPLFHIAFYRFVRVDDPEALAQRVRAWAQGLTGSVRIAHEGINGALAGAAQALEAFEQHLQTDERFRALVFRRTGCLTPPFMRLKVQVKAEIVDLNVPGVEAVEHRPHAVGVDEWRALLDDPNTVVIDNRNAFEFRLGHFRNAIHPNVENFRDIPAWMEAHAAQWQRAGKRIAMYCTGGIRCEKTSAWLNAKGIATTELSGGILRFLQEAPDAAAHWQGECFVFDNRVALDLSLRETATTEEQVYDPARPAEAWRLARAQRLRAAVGDLLREKAS